MADHYRARDFVWVPLGGPVTGKAQRLQLAHVEGSGVAKSHGQEYSYLLVRKYSANGRRWMKTQSKVDHRTVTRCTPADLPNIERAANRRALLPHGRR